MTTPDGAPVIPPQCVDCKTAQLFADGIVEMRERRDAAIASIAGYAQLYRDIHVQPLICQIEANEKSTDEMMAERHGMGREYIPEALAETPNVRAAYFNYLDMIEGFLAGREQNFRSLVEDCPGGPRESRRYRIVGRKITVCASAYLNENSQNQG
jgi:hypothetical protein